MACWLCYAVPACVSLRNKDAASWVYVSRRLSSPLTKRFYRESGARAGWGEWEGVGTSIGKPPCLETRESALPAPELLGLLEEARDCRGGLGLTQHLFHTAV
jgi:hypothetical protein